MTVRKWLRPGIRNLGLAGAVLLDGALPAPAYLMHHAKLDWTVHLHGLSYSTGGIERPSSARALIRSSDGKELTVTTASWKPMQNRVAFEVIDRFAAEGKLTIDSAGELEGGSIVWVMAQMHSGFTVFDVDRINSYLLLTVFHKYGRATDFRFVPTREMCMNMLALESKDLIVKLNHKTTFDSSIVAKTTMFAERSMDNYRNTAELLGNTKANATDVLNYFRRIFPIAGKKNEPNRLSRGAQLAVQALSDQPGADIRAGTWWQAFNAVTYVIDHQIGTDDLRLVNSWYGQYRQKKEDALDLAAQMAESLSS